LAQLWGDKQQRAIMLKRWTDFFVAVGLRFTFGFLVIFLVLTVLCLLGGLKGWSLDNSYYKYTQNLDERQSADFYKAFFGNGHLRRLFFYIGLLAAFGGVLTAFVLPWKELPWRPDETKRDDPPAT
jgi:hypothetical protein